MIYLGIAKDLIPSLLADWLDHGLLGGPHMTVNGRLKLFSIEMHRVFKHEKIPSLALERFLTTEQGNYVGQVTAFVKISQHASKDSCSETAFDRKEHGPGQQE